MRAMALETVRIAAVLPVSADRVYAAWLDSREHARMTGSPAVVDPALGGDYSAWDGYISGKNLELEPARRIVQSWRSTDFPLGHADSRLEVHLLEAPGGCEIALIHSGIPEGQAAQYEQGWHDHYLEPMRKYFAKKPAKKAAGKVAKKPARKAAASDKGRHRSR